MKLELRRFFENDNLKQDFDYSFTADDDLFSSDVAVKGCVKTVTGIVSLEAEVSVTVTTECAKCAKEVIQRLNVPVSHLLIDKLNEKLRQDHKGNKHQHKG